jgi:CheY-like chemotaxis protein
MSLTPASSASISLPLALLADHDADARHMYALYLERSTCRVEQAEDGREALAKAVSRQPGVIVTETRLPGISGFELSRLLRSDRLTSSIPVVIVTGDAMPRDVERAWASGAAAVLVKPCLPEHLATEVRRLLRVSIELRKRSADVRERADAQGARAGELIEHSRGVVKRRIASRAYERYATDKPPAEPPMMVCPQCDQVLRYVNSHLGGVSERNAEQWDYYECAGGCGTFQYRQRSRKLRRVG